MSLAAISMDQLDEIFSRVRQIEAIAVALATHNALAEMSEQLLSELFSIFISMIREVINTLKKP